MTSLEDGGFVAAWYSGNNNDLRGQRYDANGEPAGSEFVVIDPSHGPSEVSVTGLKDGGFVASWTSNQDGSGYGVYGQRI